MKTKQQKEIIDAIINEVTMWSESEEDFRTLDITGRIEKALKGKILDEDLEKIVHNIYSIYPILWKYRVDREIKHGLPV
ncbi:MAG: hypothetical protein J6J09_06585 [Phocaeicola sp.]|jgi:hypothetical protein|uniref:Uncharacterized protein n=1 Tax=Xylanibacter ruminicola TaxID=839 RepID=A0A1M7FRI4_XYLRU|nr:hypothetical protein [Xylanibacter ruminicola]MBP3714975.1 hypothetical protein [Phocaeicola sp.]SFC50576.1 hypothetical protein SAMN04488493_10877 [Xylanibacter ruminicola]SHM06732.1 hypothetical protein SAMN04488494_1244 [Xylanibacter ruminicola]